MDLPVLVTNGIQVAACIKVEDFLSLAWAFTRQQIHLVITVQMCLEVLAVGLMALLTTFSLISGSPTAAIRVGIQSSWEKMSLMTVPGLTIPGHLTIIGTLKPPSQVVPFSPRNGVVPPSGQVNFSAPLSVLKITMVLSAIPSSSKLVEQYADAVVKFHHAVCIHAITGLALVLFTQVCPDMHTSGIVPDKEGFPCLHVPVR